MSYFRFKRLEDGKIKKYRSKGLEVIQKITVDGVEKEFTSILPVWNKNNTRISIDTIRSFGWSIEFVPSQSADRVEYLKFKYFYDNSVDLAAKVTALKDLYDDLEVDYDCDASIMEDAIINKYGNDSINISDQIADTAEDLAIVLTEVYHKYLKVIEKDDDANPVGAWSLYQDFPTLCDWLPGNYSDEDIPEEQLPFEITNEEMFEEMSTHVHMK